jgi:hypothetical protein
LRYLFERVLAVLDLRVVRRDAVADEPVRDGKLLVHVNNGISVLVHQPVCRVEAGRARADDGDAEPPPSACSRAVRMAV